MIKRNIINFVFLSLSLLVSSTSYATTNISPTDTTSEVVYLRKDCTNITNCATTLQEILNWTWGTRNPSASNPLMIDIGTGVFEGIFDCTNSGYVTLRGTGMQNTILENGAGAGKPVIKAINCFNLVFSDMTFRDVDFVYATQNNGGTSTWTNVEIEGKGHGWVDDPSYACAHATGKHYWFNSRITTTSLFTLSRAYYNACDESWFFGSEITSIVTQGGPIAAIVARGGEVHIYGSNIRVLSGVNVNNAGLVAAQAIEDGEIHIHGTGIDVISAENNNIVAFITSQNGIIHANETAYVLKTDTANGGTITRIQSNGGIAMAPYQWPQNTTAPQITTVNGADTFVETDCDSLGDCSGNSQNPQHPHMMVYDATCVTNGPWFDIATNACRQ